MLKRRLARIFAFGLFCVGPTGHSQSAPTGVDLNPHIQYDKPTGTKLPQYVETRESKVFHNGVEYRHIEYNNQAWEVKANEPESTVDCSRTNLPPDTFATEGTVKLTRRTGLFIESLRQHCDPRLKAIVTNPNPMDSNIGIDFPPSKPGDSDKKILYNPKRNMGAVRTDF